MSKILDWLMPWRGIRRDLEETRSILKRTQADLEALIDLLETRVAKLPEIHHYRDPDPP